MFNYFVKIFNKKNFSYNIIISDFKSTIALLEWLCHIIERPDCWKVSALFKRDQYNI